MTSANEPLNELRFCIRFIDDCNHSCIHQKKDSLCKYVLTVDDVLAKVKELKRELCMNTTFCGTTKRFGHKWFCRNCGKIDSVFGEATDNHGAAAKKEKNETVADTLQSMDVQGKAVSPSQNSQKCKECNQDFEGQHRSYCPTLKDRTRKVSRWLLL